MNLTPTAEQTMLTEALDRALAGVDANRLRDIWGRDHLRTEYGRLAEIGLLELIVAACDPDDCHLAEVALVGEALGRHAAILPVVTSVAFAAVLLERSGADPAAVAELTAGSTIWSLAASAAGQRDFLAPPACTLTLDSGRHLLAGRTTHVDFAAAATGFVVWCATPDGPAIVAVDAAADGVTVEASETLGGAPSGSVSFHDVEPRAILFTGAAATDALHDAWATVLLLQAGYLAGAAQRLLDLSCDHVLNRKQFGVPIGTFQAVQHHLANSKIALDSSQLMVSHTAWLGLHADRLGLAAETKAWAAETAVDLARWSHELHGGVGVVDDHEVSLLSRRIIAEATAYGSPRQLWATAAALRGRRAGIPA